MSFTILDTPMSAPRAPSSGTSIEVSQRSRDFFAFALWVVVTFVQFPGDQLILYPLALYFAYSAWRDQRKIFALLSRAWVLVLFPAWSLLSILWAVEPTEALKGGLYLSLTMLICFQVAVSLTPRQVLHAVLLAVSGIIVYNLFVIQVEGLPAGMFTSKNAMGKNMVVAYTISLAVTLDSKSRPWTRLTALVLAVLAFYASLISDSATAVLLVFGSTMAMLSLIVFLSGGLLRPSRLAFLFMIFGLGVGAAAVTLPTVQIDPVQTTLDAFGKDRTLTGRTQLWGYARDQIEEQPYLGVGSGGFWRYHASPLVQRIHEEFYKGPRDVFNFHSSWYEIAVHQGYIGLAMVGAASLWGAKWLLIGAARLGTMPAIYFATHAVAVIARFFTEADFLKPFVIFHMLFWIGALLALRQIAFPEMTAERQRANADSELSGDGLLTR